MRCILPIHAFLGCDTTSRGHSLGKGEALKKYIINEKFQRNMSLFNDETASYDTIDSAGEEIFCILYGAKCDEKLNKLRFHIFCKKAASSKTAIMPEVLSPTSEAAKFRSYRLFHQVQIWKGNTDILPELWGWKIVENMLLTIAMEEAPAPNNLLKIVR